jgi:dTDP-4-dehydrorhamnose reductase
MTRVLLIGASGMLGCSLAPMLERAGHSVFKQSRGEGYDIRLDILSDQAWVDCLHEIRPDVVVNLAAGTNVDKCELDPQFATAANLSPLITFRKASEATGIKPHMVQISTDQVYDGEGPHPEALVCPCNVYGLSKLAGELAIWDYPATIFRTNFFGMSRAPNRLSLSDWIVGSIRQETRITLFRDVMFSGVHIDTLCSYIGLAIEKKPIGVFNVGIHDGISKADFGLRLASELNLDTSRIKVGSVREFDFKARRPLDMRMQTKRFEDEFGIRSPDSSSQIDKTVNEYYA